MAVAKQLYELQELDTEIEQKAESLTQKTLLIGDRKVLDDAQNRLSTEKQELEVLKHQHREAEAEVDDLLSKIAEVEGQLYGGKITNPKELSNLQHEAMTMKAKSEELENNTLEIIDRVEEAEKRLAETTADFHKLEDEWQKEQKQLAADIDKLKTELADLKLKREQLSAQIEPPALALYERIRQQKKQAVVKVEQGICRACRISLSASILQKARSGQPVQCGTCGRIVFIS
jgi:predicted  nucleic acid-binding Zn-ribbon protein